MNAGALTAPGSMARQTSPLWGLDLSNAVRRRVEREGVVALGDAYERGLWNAEDLTGAMHRVFTEAGPGLSPIVWARLLLAAVDQRLFNRQAGRGAFNIGLKHYDLGNDLFEAMLDRSMTYTSGLWEHAATLDEAQEAKLDRLCQVIGLREGQHVLDIGCGWGNFARHAAWRYGARVTGLTVSREQADRARQRCAGLPVDIRLQDYRDVRGTFDHIVSIEMIEAVGRKNLPTYFKVVDRCLAEQGRFAVQVISGDTLSRTSNRQFDQFVLWLLRCIFPDGYLPKEDELIPPRDVRLRAVDWKRMTGDYERTLHAWAGNINARWDDVGEQYDERFRRRWNFYLHGCAAAFRAGCIDVSQIVFARPGAGSRS